jgi:hypothetical protein
MPQTRNVPVPDSNCPEAELLLACARTVVEPRIRERIGELLQMGIDWSLLERKAHRNYVMPLLCRNLLAHPGCLPDSVSQNLRAYLDQHAKNNLFQAMELLKIIRLLDKHGIPCLPFKGPILAATAYGDLSLRTFSDLDILVHRHHLAAAVKALRTLDYIPAQSTGQKRPRASLLNRRKDVVCVKKDGRVRVELHWRLSGSHFDLAWNISHIWERLDQVQIAGARVRNLPVSHALNYLCLHGSRHGWTRLGWICDVAELIRSQATLDWDRIITEAREAGCYRALALGVHLAHDLLEADVPKEVCVKLCINSDARAMAARVRDQLLSDCDPQLELSDWYSMHLGMRESVSDRLRLHIHYASRYMHILFRPNAKDFSLCLHLPHPALVVYLLRPLRLAKEYLLAPALARLKKRKADRVLNGSQDVSGI